MCLYSIFLTRIREYEKENEILKENLNKLYQQNLQYRPDITDEQLNADGFMSDEQFLFFKEKNQNSQEQKNLGPIPGIYNEKK